MNLRAKLLIIFVLLTTVPIGLIGYVNYQNAKQTIFEEQTASLEAAVQSRVFEIEVLTRLRTEQASLISGTYLSRRLNADGNTSQRVVANIREHLEPTLQSLKLSSGNAGFNGSRASGTFIELIEIADINGAIVASTDSTRTGGSISDFLMNTIESESDFFGGYVFDEIAQQYYLMFASSIENFELNRFSGAVLLYIQPGILREIVEEPFGTNSSEQFLILGQDNKTGSEGGFFVFAGGQGDVSSSPADNISTDQYSNPDFFSGEYSGTITKDQNGADVLAVSSKISSLNWIVVGKVNTGEIFEPVYQFRNQILIAILIIIFLSIATAYFLASSLTKPVDSLVSAFSSISKGKPTQKLNSERSDELGMLAESANQMISYLNDKMESAKRIADGKYDIDIGKAGPDDQLGNALQTMTDNLEENRLQIEALLNDLRAANSELSEKQARLQAIFDASGDAILTINKKGLIESVNPAAASLFRFKNREIATGQSVQTFLSDFSHQKYLDHKKTDTNRSVYRQGFGERTDGSFFPYSLSCSRVSWDNQQILVVIIRDLTRQRELEHQILKAGQEERRKIGHEIHEGLGQTLTGLHFIADQISNQLKSADSPFAEDIQEIADAIRQADQHAQRLYRELVLVDIEEGGLPFAIQAICNDYSDSPHIQIHTEIQKDITCRDLTVALHIVNIARDSLQYAVEKSEASKVTVSLAQNTDHTILTIEDNGMNSLIKQNGGTAAILNLMQYRTELIGGSIEVKRIDTNRNKLVCTIPTPYLISGLQ